MTKKPDPSNGSKPEKPIQTIQSNRRPALLDIHATQPVFVPHSVTRDRMRRFIKAYEFHCGNVSAACASAGVKRAAYYRWMNSHTKMCREFRQRLSRVRPEERLKDKLEFAANLLIEEAHPQLVMFGLKTKARDRGWSERVAIAPPEKTLDEEMKPLIARINEGAKIWGHTFREEALQFLEVFRPTLRPEWVERLEEMIGSNRV